jgi:hypothetical protein
MGTVVVRHAGAHSAGRVALPAAAIAACQQAAI